MAAVPPDDWRAMAKSSLQAARSCLERGEYRSAVSRAYYASFQIVTYRLRQVEGLVPRARREAWGHEQTPGLAAERLRESIGLWTIKDIRRRLEACYRQRLDADYFSERTVGIQEAKRCVADAEAVWSSLC